MNYTLREATAADIPSLAALERECFSSPWSEQAFTESMSAGNCEFLLCEGEGGVLGYVGAVRIADECSITDICTAAHARGHGIGQALLRALESRCRALCVRDIFLEVRESNSAAICLYERCGYQRCGTRRGFYSRPREDAAVYVLHLL